MSPVFAESDLSQRSYLNWGIFITALVVAGVMIAYGFLATRAGGMSVEDALSDHGEDFNQQLIEQWELVDPYLEDCSEMGYLLRQIEAKSEYTTRLFLVINQSGGDKFILINDGGVCWVNGEKEKMLLSDKDWFGRFMNMGKQPISPPSSPFEKATGTWTYTPIMNGSTVWGIMLIQHYEY